ncbi:hypothetical protein FB451DRAFT_1193309 [Mycena latifolia]|nr:hypothetical protein FB451DRAFT_1193309 [Mycena latifolia]
MSTKETLDEDVTRPLPVAVLPIVEYTISTFTTSFHISLSQPSFHTGLSTTTQPKDMPPYSQEDVDRRLAKPCSPHDRPGAVYGLEVVAPDGTIVLKAGRSACPERRTGEWQAQCFLDKIGLKWQIPTEHVIQGNGSHIEKFDVEKLGGFDVAADIARELLKQMEMRGE